MTVLESTTAGLPPVASFLGIGQNEVFEKLDPSRRHIAFELVKSLDGLIGPILDSESMAEFRERSAKSLPQLLNLLASLGYLVLADLPVLSDLLPAAFHKAEETLTASGILSPEETEQVALALTTMRINVRLLMEAIANLQRGSATQLQLLDDALRSHAAAFLNLILLIYCARRGAQRFVVAETVKGCRAAVDGYASIRQIVDLQRGDGQALTGTVLPDSEDRILAEESHAARESTLSGW